MKTVFAFLTLLSLVVLFASRDVAARKDIGGYWKNAMDSQAMPEAIKGRIDHPEAAGKGVHFAKDFDPESAGTKNKKWTGKPPPAGDLIHPQAEKSPISKAKP
ncbi:organ-specific protein S2-like [Corylus avellana]|uniref:organ-specific protein S2-like n=1 Tax=Corylus avellana TaxID=13451 RepID=UPI001E1EDDFA|nr:organ-specific protein S2-like [Corylus avellana]